jgi:hypothetical protein
MFEQEREKETVEGRSRMILWVGAFVAMVLTLGLVKLSFSPPQESPTLDNVVRAGAPEFDNYKDKVALEVIDKIVYPNMIGMAQYEIKARLHNRGDRAITGVELAGKMIALDDKLIAQSVSIPIPRVRREPLKPGESVAVSVKIDAPAKVREDDVKDLLIELRGLQF